MHYMNMSKLFGHAYFPDKLFILEQLRNQHVTFHILIQDQYNLIMIMIYLEMGEGLKDTYMPDTRTYTHNHFIFSQMTTNYHFWTNQGFKVGLLTSYFIIKL